jgi:hypothetical protein
MTEASLNVTKSAAALPEQVSMIEEGGYIKGSIDLTRHPAHSHPAHSHPAPNLNTS